MGGCNSYARARQSAPIIKHPNPFSLGGGSSMKITYGILTSTPKLTSMNIGTYVHYSPSTNAIQDKKPLSLSKSCLSQWPGDDQNAESSIKIDTEDLPTEERREGSCTVTVEEDWTATNGSQEDGIPAGRMETERNTVNPQQPQKFEYEVTKLPLGIVDLLRKLISTGNPESKAIAEVLLEWISKRPWSEYSKQYPVAPLMSMSVDLNIGVKGNSVNIISEPVGEPNVQDSPSSSFASQEGETFVADSEGKTKLNRLSDEEAKKSEISHQEMIEISKQRFHRNRRKSEMMSEFLEGMPSLTQFLDSTTKRGTNLKVSWYKSSSAQKETLQDDQQDACFLSMTSKIDLLDKRISESSLKITELRRTSLGLLTAGGDPGDSQENGNNITYVSVEKEISLWQDRKNKLVDERDEIVTELHELIGNITLTSLYSPTSPNESRVIQTDPQCSQSPHSTESMKMLVAHSDLKMPDIMVSSSFSPVSNLSPIGARSAGLEASTYRGK